MRVSEVQTRDVVHVVPSLSVRSAAELMRKQHVGTLVVVDKPNGERIPIGILTDRDIVLEVVAAGVNADSVTVTDIMTAQPATCTEDQDLFHVIEIMRVRGVRRLPVINSKGGLVGIISSDDIYAALNTHFQELTHALTTEQVHEMETRR